MSHRSRIRAQRRRLAALHFTLLDRLFQNADHSLGAILRLERFSRSVHGAQDRGFHPDAHRTLHPDFLDTAIEMLRRRGYDIMSLDDLRKRLRQAKPSDGRMVAIVVEGADTSFSEFGLPVLRHHAVPFTLFAPTGFMERAADPWRDYVRVLVGRQSQLVLATQDGPVRFACGSVEEKYRAYTALVEFFENLDGRQLQQQVRELCWLYKIDLDDIQAESLMTWADYREVSALDICTPGNAGVDGRAIATLSDGEVRAQFDQAGSVIEAETGVRPASVLYPHSTKGTSDTVAKIAKRLRLKVGITLRPGVIRASNSASAMALPSLRLNGNFQRRRYLGPVLSGLPATLPRIFDT